MLINRCLVPKLTGDVDQVVVVAAVLCIARFDAILLNSGL